MDLGLVVNKTKAQKVEGDANYILISPLLSDIEDDNVLTYVAFDPEFHFRVGLGVSNPGTVLFFHPEYHEYLKAIVESNELFGVDLAVLIGKIGTASDNAFDSITWELEKISYPVLVENVNVESEFIRDLEEHGKTTNDKERERFTRRSGNVKQHTNFDLFNGDIFEKSKTVDSDDAEEDIDPNGGV